MAPYALAAGRQGLDLPTTLLGFALAHGALGTAMTIGLGMGSGALVAFWAVAAVLAACTAAKVRTSQFVRSHDIVEGYQTVPGGAYNLHKRGLLDCTGFVLGQLERVATAIRVC